MPKAQKLRLISGQFGGRYILTPPTSATQPMSNRARQAIFNRLRGELKDSLVLDAFAGSGALGLEALSLGARWVDFVDQNPLALKTIQKNLALLYRSTPFPAALFLSFTKLAGRSYDFIFADPPYNHPQYELIPLLIQILKPSGTLILSRPAAPTPPNFDHLELLAHKKYAAANLNFYLKNNT